MISSFQTDAERMPDVLLNDPLAAGAGIALVLVGCSLKKTLSVSGKEKDSIGCNNPVVERLFAILCTGIFLRWRTGTAVTGIDRPGPS